LPQDLATTDWYALLLKDFLYACCIGPEQLCCSCPALASWARQITSRREVQSFAARMVKSVLVFVKAIELAYWSMQRELPLASSPSHWHSLPGVTPNFIFLIHSSAWPSNNRFTLFAFVS
jgi:hypothetical protein